MRVYQTNEIKNIALLGSAGSGKTTLAESMLFEAGVIKRRGSVEAKNTVSDYFPVELEYGYSVFPTVFHVEWNNKKLNIIDCPGSDDFVGGAITSLNVTDQAVILINGQRRSISGRSVARRDRNHVHRDIPRPDKGPAATCRPRTARAVGLPPGRPESSVRPPARIKQIASFIGSV